jgi:hypothetical protein
MDTGVFAESYYWDMEVCYAKASPTQVRCRILLHNRGPSRPSKERGS